MVGSDSESESELESGSDQGYFKSPEKTKKCQATVSESDDSPHESNDCASKVQESQAIDTESDSVPPSYQQNNRFEINKNFQMNFNLVPQRQPYQYQTESGIHGLESDDEFMNDEPVDIEENHNDEDIEIFVDESDDYQDFWTEGQHQVSRGRSGKKYMLAFLVLVLLIVAGILIFIMSKGKKKRKDIDKSDNHHDSKNDSKSKYPKSKKGKKDNDDDDDDDDKRKKEKDPEDDKDKEKDPKDDKEKDPKDDKEKDPKDDKDKEKDDKDKETPPSDSASGDSSQTSSDKPKESEAPKPTNDPGPLKKSGALSFTDASHPSSYQPETPGGGPLSKAEGKPSLEEGQKGKSVKYHWDKDQKEKPKYGVDVVGGGSSFSTSSMTQMTLYDKNGLKSKTIFSSIEERNSACMNDRQEKPSNGQPSLVGKVLDPCLVRFNDDKPMRVTLLPDLVGESLGRLAGKSGEDGWIYVNKNGFTNKLTSENHNSQNELFTQLGSGGISIGQMEAALHDQFIVRRGGDKSLNKMSMEDSAWKSAEEGLKEGLDKSGQRQTLEQQLEGEILAIVRQELVSLRPNMVIYTPRPHVQGQESDLSLPAFSGTKYWFRANDYESGGGMLWGDKDGVLKLYKYAYITQGAFGLLSWTFYVYWYLDSDKGNGYSIDDNWVYRFDIEWCETLNVSWKKIDWKTGRGFLQSIKTFNVIDRNGNMVASWSMDEWNTREMLGGAGPVELVMKPGTDVSMMIVCSLAITVLTDRMGSEFDTPSDDMWQALDYQYSGTAAGESSQSESSQSMSSKSESAAASSQSSESTSSESESSAASNSDSESQSDSNADSSQSSMSDSQSSSESFFEFSSDGSVRESDSESFTESDSDGIDSINQKEIVTGVKLSDKSSVDLKYGSNFDEVEELVL